MARSRCRSSAPSAKTSAAHHLLQRRGCQRGHHWCASHGSEGTSPWVLCGQQADTKPAAPQPAQLESWPWPMPHPLQQVLKVRPPCTQGLHDSWHAFLQFSAYTRRSENSWQGCGCQTFLAGRVSCKLPRFAGKVLRAMLSCQGLGTFRQGRWLLENRPRLRELSWIFSSETAATFLSFFFFLIYDLFKLRFWLHYAPVNFGSYLLLCVCMYVYA